MQCKEVALVLGKGGWTALPNEVRAHIVIYNSCLNLVANLREIVATTHQLSTEVEPPARVWLSLRKQLEEEGIIKPI